MNHLFISLFIVSGTLLGACSSSSGPATLDGGDSTLSDASVSAGQGVSCQLSGKGCDCRLTTDTRNSVHCSSTDIPDTLCCADTSWPSNGACSCQPPCSAGGGFCSCSSNGNSATCELKRCCLGPDSCTCDDQDPSVYTCSGGTTQTSSCTGFTRCDGGRIKVASCSAP